MMNRRNAITTLSGVLATAAVLASGRARAEATGSGPSQYKTGTLQVGTLSLQTSELAIAHATHPKVKEFAGFERNEQMAMAQVLTNMNNPPPVALNAQNTALLQQLQAKSGKAFDVAYVQGQIAGHQELMKIQQSFLDGMPTELADKDIAILARTVIQMHLAILADLQTALTA